MDDAIPNDCVMDYPEAEYLLEYDFPDACSTQLLMDPLNNSTSEMEHASDAGADDSEGEIFGCVLLAYKRQFKGQSSGSYIARWQISANSTASFIHKVWILAEEHLYREVVFIAKTDGTTCPAWGAEEKPIEEKFGKFVLFQSGRRHYTLDQVVESSSLLQSWRNKEITLLLHVYSLSVSNRTIWSSVKESLVDPSDRDRSGAATTQAVIELADELRTMHDSYLDAHGMAWSFWANSIHNGPAHLRETLKNHPPQHLAHLFRAKEGQHVNAILRELTVAHSLNNSYHEEVVALRQVFDVVESNIEHLSASMKMFKIRLEALELRDQVNESMISAMETTVKVQECKLGERLKAQVSDMEDVDHM
ncbi:uncharacterized protein LOC134215632 [Armigeres subalbatus]|uniref:uncharacterized protein LOC134215632 n=1 Tax=Armigeres subalbatus TaxID=124917 RepID=UPI002ED1C7A5